MSETRKTKPEMQKEIKDLTQKIDILERFLDEKGLLDEALAYVENTISDIEELPFD